MTAEKMTVDIQTKMQRLMYALTKKAAMQSYSYFLTELGISDEEYEEIKSIWKDALGVEPYV